MDEFFIELGLFSWMKAVVGFVDGRYKSCGHEF
jgi:hypothetical protein